MMIFVFDSIQNIVGKVENAGYQHFRLFPQCFQNVLLCRVVISLDCVVESYSLAEWWQHKLNEAYKWLDFFLKRKITCWAKKNENVW